jgi:2-polyprenyl-6-hydroxyphenyl methylase/3-demethylubiquinone-9 3-methyltransferase
MPRGDDVDRDELERFDALSDSWWKSGKGMRALHDITPTRAAYVAARTRLRGRRVLDVGCGGGILSEALARRGAAVTGIDPGYEAIRAARRHSREAGLDLEYKQASAEAYAGESRQEYDCVLCMELLEHVPRPGDLVRACAGMARPGGDVFFATISRNILAVLLAVYVAEHCLGIVAKGTHDWRAFVRPSELAAWTAQSGLTVLDVSGLIYVPGIRICRVAGPPAVNYLMHCRRPGAGEAVTGPDNKGLEEERG